MHQQPTPRATPQKKKGRDNPALIPQSFSDQRPPYFEKLATASASVLYTSKMVISFVICSTS